MSAFINLAAALGEGHAETASALFILGKDSLESETRFPAGLTEDTIRAVRRGPAPVVVTAVNHATSAEALKAHHGDQRLSVQRALAANPHTPEETLEWVFRNAVKRHDTHLITQLADRIPVPVLFDVLGTLVGLWPRTLVGSRVFHAGPEWVERAQHLGILGVYAGVVAEAIRAGHPAEPLLSAWEHTSAEKLMAHVARELEYLPVEFQQRVNDDLVDAFLTEFRHAGPSVVRITAEQFEWFATRAAGRTAHGSVEEHLIATFRPADGAHEVFVNAALTLRNWRNFSTLFGELQNMDIALAETLVRHAVQFAHWGSEELYRLLPAGVSEEIRLLVLARVSFTAAKVLLLRSDPGEITRGRIAALCSSQDNAQKFASWAMDPGVQQQPWFGDLIDVLGPHFLARVRSDARVAGHVAAWLTESLNGSTEAIVLAAKLIHDGFSGSLSELVASVAAITAS